MFVSVQKEALVRLTNSRKGYTQHGDYVFGWKGDSLQKAMDNRCTGDTCTQLELQTTTEAMKCTLPPTVKDNFDGCELALNFTDETF